MHVTSISFYARYISKICITYYLYDNEICFYANYMKKYFQKYKNLIQVILALFNSPKSVCISSFLYVNILFLKWSRHFKSYLFALKCNISTKLIFFSFALKELVSTPIFLHLLNNTLKLLTVLKWYSELTWQKYQICFKLVSN